MLSGPECIIMAEIQATGPMSQPEPTVAEQTAQLARIILSLEQLWLEPELRQEIDAETWRGFMGALYQELADFYLSIK